MTIDETISTAFRAAFAAHPQRHSDPALALDSARETASALVPDGVTGTFDDETLTFRQDDDDSHGDWLWLIDAYTPGTPVDDAYLARFAEVAEVWLTEHEGEERGIRVRPTVAGQIAGIYRIHDNGNRQITGGSVPTPETIRELAAQAWQHACETTPTDDIAHGLTFAAWLAAAGRTDSASEYDLRAAWRAGEDPAEYAR